MQGAVERKQGALGRCSTDRRKRSISHVAYCQCEMLSLFCAEDPRPPPARVIKYKVFRREWQSSPDSVSHSQRVSLSAPASCFSITPSCLPVPPGALPPEHRPLICWLLLAETGSRAITGDRCPNGAELLFSECSSLCCPTNQQRPLCGRRECALCLLVWDYS